MGFFSDLGDHWVDGWEAVGDAFELAGESFADGDILGGIGEGFLAVGSGVGNVITLGGAGAVGDAIADDTEYVTDGEGHVTIKDPGLMDKVVMGIGDNALLRDELCDEGKILEANLEGAKLVAAEAVATATVAVGVGAGSAAVTAGSQAAAGLTGGAAVKAAVTSGGKALLLGSAESGGLGLLGKGGSLALKQFLVPGAIGVGSGALTTVGGLMSGQELDDALLAGAKSGVGTTFLMSTPLGACIGLTNMTSGAIDNNSQTMAQLSTLNSTETFVQNAVNEGYILPENAEKVTDLCNEFALTMTYGTRNVIDFNDPEQFAVLESELQVSGLLEPKYFEDCVIDAFAEQYANGEVSANYVNEYAKLYGKLCTGQIADENMFNLAANCIALDPDNANCDTILTAIETGSITPDSVYNAIEQYNSGNVVSYFAQTTPDYSNLPEGNLGVVVSTDVTADMAAQYTENAMSNVYSDLVNGSGNMNATYDPEAYFTEKYGQVFTDFKDALVAKRVEVVLQSEGLYEIADSRSAMFDKYDDLYENSFDKLSEMGAEQDQGLIDYLNGDMGDDIHEEADKIVDAIQMDY